MGVRIGFWIKIAQDAVSIFLNLRKTFMTKCLSSLPFAWVASHLWSLYSFTSPDKVHKDFFW